MDRELSARRALPEDGDLVTAVRFFTLAAALKPVKKVSTPASSPATIPTGCGMNVPTMTARAVINPVAASQGQDHSTTVRRLCVRPNEPLKLRSAVRSLTNFLLSVARQDGPGS